MKQQYIDRKFSTASMVLIGIVDMLTWAYTGSQLTSIPWGSNRGMFLALWPIYSAIITIVVTGSLLS